MPSRSPTQVASHAQKFQQRIALKGSAGKRRSRFAAIEQVRGLEKVTTLVFDKGLCHTLFRFLFWWTGGTSLNGLIEKFSAVCMGTQGLFGDSQQGPESSIARAQGLLGLQPDAEGRSLPDVLFQQSSKHRLAMAPPLNPQSVHGASRPSAYLGASPSPLQKDRVQGCCFLGCGFLSHASCPVDVQGSYKPGHVEVRRFWCELSLLFTTAAAVVLAAPT